MTLLCIFIDELIAARGKLPVQIPAGLEDGRYVFRTELIALHEADKTISKLLYVEVSNKNVMIDHVDFRFSFNRGGPK